MFRPCIDIHNGKVKQIIGGTLTDTGEGIVENFISSKSPAYYANMFKKDNLKGGHIIMLGKGNEKAAIEALNAYPKGLQIGGGINHENALDFLNEGASHIIVTSYLFDNGEVNLNNLERISELVSKDKLVIDLSCRMKNGSYYVVTDRWQSFTNFEINKKNIEILESYCDEFLIHGVDVEGKKQGIDIKLVELISNIVSIPVTYAGGINSFEDIKTINNVGKGKINYTVGSALDIFGGNMEYKEVVEKANMIAKKRNNV